ncbi:MAG: ABC transporter ATP-binding protein, partial [Oscillospiraceae bacterium]
DQFTREVIEFADIGEFISMPVKTYSSGMRARLGFAIATQINPDILVIDEGLSVGDQTFTQKCLERTESLRSSGKTIFLVSHGMSMIKSFCSKVIWLEYGEMVAFGDTEEILPQYQEFLSSYNAMSPEQRREYRRGIQKRQGHALLGEVEAPSSRADIRARYGHRPFITLVLCGAFASAAVFRLLTLVSAVCRCSAGFSAPGFDYAGATVYSGWHGRRPTCCCAVHGVLLPRGHLTGC